MDLGAVDRSATQGRSWLHASAPAAKLVALALLLGAVIASWNPFVLASIAVMLAAAAESARLPRRTVAALAGYPSIFALIFAFAASAGLVAGLTIVLKAVTAALAAVIVVLTTPYPRIFAPIQRITPAVVGDSLLVTYRSAYLLLGKFVDTTRAVRLRAGLRRRRPLRSARAATLALGSVLLYSLDLAQRDYDVMRLRGYERALRIAPPARRDPLASAVVLAGATLLLAVSIAWRLEWRLLNPWSWLAPLPALVVLAVALAARWRKQT